jgi:flagellar biosynthesis protein FliR
VTLAVLSLRGVAAIVVLTTLVGGIPRIASAALAVTLGVWSAVMIAPHAAGIDVSWVVAVSELAIGAALGVLGALPLLAAAAAGRLVDLAATGKAQGTYSLLFGVLAAAVFVGIDGHVAVLRAIVDSHTSMPAVGSAQATVMASLGHLIPAAVRLAVPWLVTAAVVQIAVGVGMRVAGRTSAYAPSAVAVPAALVMMTASLVATLAVAIAAVMRGAL